jgi:hypothetical protein
MRVARDGSLQLYYSRELGGNDQDSIQRISYDEGASWSSERTISGAGIASRDGMLGLAPYNGKLIAVFETNEHGPMAIKSVESPGMFSTRRCLQLTDLYRRWSNLGKPATCIFWEGFLCRCSTPSDELWGEVSRYVSNRRRK